MPIDVSAIPPEDLTALGECVRAVAYGPFFPDVEMHSLLGADRAEVARISDEWPESLTSRDADWIVQNILTNLTGYPIDSPERWSEFIHLTEDGVRDLKRRYLVYSAG